MPRAGTAGPALGQPAAPPDARGQRPRPAEQLAAAIRRSGWIVAIGLVALVGPLFAWTLGRARQAPPAATALPAADVRLLSQNERLALRIRRDEQAMSQVSARLDRLSVSGGAPIPVRIAAPGPATLSKVHATTGAS